MLQTHLLVALLCYSLMGCSQADNSTGAPPPLAAASPMAPGSPAPPTDTLRFHARPAFEITHVEQRHDTLLVVSGSPAVAYPLGKWATPQAFRARYPGFALTFRDEDPDSTGVVRVYTATKGTNVVRFFKADGQWMETASGTVTDQSLSLTTGVRVGMSQQAFLNTFFTAPLTLPARPIGTLALIYVVDGAMQYCHVSQGVTDKIQMASVFTIQ